MSSNLKTNKVSILNGTGILNISKFDDSTLTTKLPGNQVAEPNNNIITDVTKLDDFKPVSSWAECLDRYELTNPFGIPQAASLKKRKACYTSELLSEACELFKKKRLKFIIKFEDGSREGSLVGTSIFMNNDFISKGSIQCFVIPSNSRTKSFLETAGYMEIKFSFLNDIPSNGVLPNLASLLPLNASPLAPCHAPQNETCACDCDYSSRAPTGYPGNTSLSKKSNSLNSETDTISIYPGDLTTTKGGIVECAVELLDGKGINGKMTKIGLVAYSFEVAVIVDLKVYSPMIKWSPSIRKENKFTKNDQFRLLCIAYCNLKKIHQSDDPSSITEAVSQFRNQKSIESYNKPVSIHWYDEAVNMFNKFACDWSQIIKEQ